MCGIGGRTIAEAQQRISYPEFRKWCAFRSKRGVLHVGQRIDYAVAQLTANIVAIHTPKGRRSPSVRDFVPNPYDEASSVISLERAMEEWR